MKKTALTVLLVLFTISTAAIHNAEHDTFKVRGEISQEENNLYPEQRVVEFPAVKSGDETVEYSNAFYKEYVSWQVGDKGLQKIRSKLKSEISLNGIRTGSTTGNIEITFVQNESIQRNYTYEELQELIPSQVRGSYEINGETVNTTVPVKLSKKDIATKDQPDYSVAKASESFGSSSRGELQYQFQDPECNSGRTNGGGTG